MQTYFITANDTDVGKTYLVGVLAKHFAEQGKRVQIVKAIDCGNSGDAAQAASWANSPRVSKYTLASYPQALAPMAAHQSEDHGQLHLSDLVQELEALPLCDIRLIEGAGGVAVPIDADNHDWLDFAKAIEANLTIAVVDNRLGAINQSRLLHAYLSDLPHALVLNKLRPTSLDVTQSNLDALRDLKIPLLGILGPSAAALYPFFKDKLQSTSPRHSSGYQGLQAGLQIRKSNHCFRQLVAPENPKTILNLANNDYLGLGNHPEVITAAKEAMDRHGSSASASPLVTGYTTAHQALEHTVSQWYHERPALIWNSGYAANQSVLKLFVQRGDIVLADRLIHHSLISGIQQSGARLLRFPHNDLDKLEGLLNQHAGTTIHVVTESLYSMDGDYPDLNRLASLKSQHHFHWYLDEAHALGWYGPSGAGMAEAAGVLDSVDILIGTLGKALASVGAFTIFHQEWMRDLCINEAGEFIYSTYLPPASAAAAHTAIKLVQSPGQARTDWQQRARKLRANLRTMGWKVLGEDSPILSVICGSSERALKMADAFHAKGLKVAAIRPPTVPKGTARLRLSLRSNMTNQDEQKLLQCFEQCTLCHA